MFIGQKPKAPASKTKITLIAILLLFLTYQVWSQHDSLTFDVVTATAGGILTSLGDQVNISEAPGNFEHGEIPKKIWYKLGPKGLSEQAKQWTSSCIDQNPEYEHEFLTVSSSGLLLCTQRRSLLLFMASSSKGGTSKEPAGYIQSIQIVNKQTILTDDHLLCRTQQPKNT